MRIAVTCRLLFAAAAAIAYVCALLPGNPMIVSYDKGNHGIAFATLGMLARLGWPRARASHLALTLIAFGALIEMSQAMPAIHRDASWGDLLADTIAALGGLLFGRLLQAMLDRTTPAARGDPKARRDPVESVRPG